MGNQLCCDETNKPPSEIQKLQDLQVVSRKPQHKQEGEIVEVQIYNNHGKESSIKHQSIVHIKEQSTIHHPIEEEIEIPKHSQRVLAVLKRTTPGTVEPQKLESLFRDIAVVHRKKYGSQVYEGQFDHNGKIPHGLGKMHKPDGSLFLGYFSHGKANGIGTYIFNNGSFYAGDFNNNVAETSGKNNGYYENDDLKYTGGFKDNTFHGQCHQIGKDHTFEGQYKHGVRSKGTLKWKALEGDYQYTGNFNSNNNFQGKGILKEPKGVYEGDFNDGDKHGEGFYKSTNGTKYRGSYFLNQRSGKGIIYNNDDTIAYQGELKNGLPHGEGEVIGQQGFKKASWIQGIDASLIEG